MPVRLPYQEEGLSVVSSQLESLRPWVPEWGLATSARLCLLPAEVCLALRNLPSLLLLLLNSSCHHLKPARTKVLGVRVCMSPLGALSDGIFLLKFLFLS